MFADLTIRNAVPSEVSDLAGLAFSSWERGILPLLADRGGLRDSERRRLNTYVAECVARIIVAEYDGEVAGWCSRARGRAYIPYLFVSPFLQGRGIGSHLLTRMESILALEGFDRVHLETPADHVLAVRFYERLGYNILAMRPNGRGAHEALVSIRLEKQLSPYRGIIGD